MLELRGLCLHIELLRGVLELVEVFQEGLLLGEIVFELLIRLFKRFLRFRVRALDPALHNGITEYELTLQPTFNHECTGTFEKTMGIPCGRTIRGLMGLDSKVSAAHFDVYWLYNRPVLAPDPLVDVPAQFGMIELTNIDPLLPDPADIPLPPPAVLLPLKVRAKVVHAKTTRLQSTSHQHRREMEALALLG